MGVVEIEETEGEDHGFHLNDLKCEKARDLIKHLADFFNRDMSPLIWFDCGLLQLRKIRSCSILYAFFSYSILSFKICCFWFVFVRLSSRKALSSLFTVWYVQIIILFFFSKSETEYLGPIYVCVRDFFYLFIYFFFIFKESVCERHSGEYTQSHIHWKYLLKNFTNF